MLPLVHIFSSSTIHPFALFAICGDFDLIVIFYQNTLEQHKLKFWGHVVLLVELPKSINLCSEHRIFSIFGQWPQMTPGWPLTPCVTIPIGIVVHKSPWNPSTYSLAFWAFQDNDLKWPLLQESKHNWMSAGFLFWGKWLMKQICVKILSKVFLIGSIKLSWLPHTSSRV